MTDAAYSPCGYISLHGVLMRFALVNTVTNRHGSWRENMRIPITAGRSFDASDNAAAPPRVVVSESVAKQWFAGGSSAGSAAAVAAGLCFATVDTDAVGSVRLPAACCGVVGFKGSSDLISTKGILGDQPVDDFVRWMAHAAVTTRSAADTALVLNALADRDVDLPPRLPSPTQVCESAWAINPVTIAPF